ncbi:hypothetical protein [Aquimarina pacifica]|uniref:hypothetical protein n=1 Tax=Aquimarina pacifica TaxID=1296415 RepID=UPI000470DB9C|nr:hypothetical protein [Aquimarina pacifica]
MNNTFKKGVRLFLIILGAIALISEISSIEKNYYIQSIGVVLLMLGVFLVNTKVKPKEERISNSFVEEEE